MFLPKTNICTQTRINHVGAASCRPHNDSMATHNTEIGNIIENEITILSSSYHGVTVDCFVIMPNHIHMIICINWVDDGRQDAAPTEPETERAIVFSGPLLYNSS